MKDHSKTLAKIKELMDDRYSDEYVGNVFRREIASSYEQLVEDNENLRIKVWGYEKIACRKNLLEERDKLYKELEIAVGALKDIAADEGEDEVVIADEALSQLNRDL